MTTDRERLNQLSVHLKRASDALLGTAQNLAMLSHNPCDPEGRCAGALDQLIAMAIEMAAMECIMRTLTAGDADQGFSRLAAGKLSLGS